MFVRAVSRAVALTTLAMFAAHAEEVVPPGAAPAAAAGEASAFVPPAPVSATPVMVPALTPVGVRIDAELSSKKSRIGDRFPIHVDADVIVDGFIVIPAGSAGEGEVIHAAKSGAGGKAGELIIAARFVRVADQDVKLRSLNIGAAGKDRTDASLATGVFTGPIGLFVVGGVVTIPKDSVGLAKTAVDLQLPGVPAAVDATTK